MKQNVTLTPRACFDHWFKTAFKIDTPPIRVRVRIRVRVLFFKIGTPPSMRADLSASRPCRAVLDARASFK